MDKNIRTATFLALGTAFISGINTLLSKTVVMKVSDPVVFTTLKNMVVAVLLIGTIILWNKRGEIAKLSKKQWSRLLAIGMVGGSVPFALFFIGLTQTSGINAALIHKTLFIWVLLLAVPILKEKVNAWQVFGIGAIFAANIFVGGFGGFAFNTGELMILAATLFWAVENIIAKKTLEDVSSILVAGARMIFGSLILLGIVIWNGSFGVVTELSGAQWFSVVLTGVLLTGYVTTWYAALKRAPVTYVATLLVSSTLITNILTAVFITHTFSEQVFITTLLYIVGFLCVIGFADYTSKQAPKQLSSGVR